MNFKLSLISLCGRACQRRRCQRRCITCQCWAWPQDDSRVDFGAGKAGGWHLRKTGSADLSPYCSALASKWMSPSSASAQVILAHCIQSFLADLHMHHGTNHPWSQFQFVARTCLTVELCLLSPYSYCPPRSPSPICIHVPIASCASQQRCCNYSKALACVLISGATRGASLDPAASYLSLFTQPRCESDAEGIDRRGREEASPHRV